MESRRKSELNNIQTDMYQAYKTSMFAKGKTPEEFDQWRETLGADDIAGFDKKSTVSNIEHSAPEPKKEKDSKSTNEKLQEFWKDDAKKSQSEETYVCKKCNVEKPLSEYYDDNTLKGHMSTCKTCKATYAAQKYKAENQHLKEKTTKKVETPKIEKKSTQEKVQTVKELNNAVVNPEHLSQEVFTLTREEIIEFGKECYARGKNSHKKLTTEHKKSLMSAIVS